MEIFELAKLLGEAIKKDARLVEFEEAKKAYENDTELKKALEEYDVQQQALQSEMMKEEKDSYTIDAINERINELYHKSKAEGLTEEEKAEQAVLRREYIDSFKRSLTGQLDNMYIVDEKGNKTKVERKGNKK